MTNILDNLRSVSRLDRSGMLDSIRQLADQCAQAWLDTRSIRIPKAYKQLKHVVIHGMGGSGLPAHLLSDVFGTELRIPLEILHGYTLPGSVGPQTLYLASSYSGNTEETLHAVRQAIARRARVLVLTSGGALAQFMKQKRLLGYQFNPVHNPCGSPRMGLGYGIVGTLGLLDRTGFLRVTKRELAQSVAAIRRADRRFNVQTPIRRNPAKQFAEDTKNRFIFFVASDHLVGNAHIVANQVNENGKQLAAFFSMPEMNHHLLEGLRKSQELRTRTRFFFFVSKRYAAKLRQRYQVTQTIINRAGFSTASYVVGEGARLAEAMETLAFSSYASFYLGILNNLDPTPIPTVDFLKRRLA